MKHTRDVKILRIRMMRCDRCTYTMDQHRRQRPHSATKSNKLCTARAHTHTGTWVHEDLYPILIHSHESSTRIGCSIMYCDCDWRCRRHFGNNLSDSLFWFVFLSPPPAASPLPPPTSPPPPTTTTWTMNVIAYCASHDTIWKTDAIRRRICLCRGEMCPVISWQIDGKATWIENIMP